MESDFGIAVETEISADDDWIQNYDNFVAGYHEWIDQGLDIEVRETVSLPLGKKSKKKKKEKCAIEANESIRKNSKKKRKRGKVSDPLNIHSAESFYSFILSWAVSEVRNDRSMVSSLPPLPICIRRFDSSQEYLDTMLSICLEECRANLQISSRLIDSSKHIGSSMTINSKSMSTGYVTLTNILCIDCRIQSITDGSFNEDYSHLQSKLSFKTALAVHKPGMIYLLQLQIGPSVVIEQFCMLRSCLDNEQLECQTGGINTSCMITLSLYVVYPSSLFQQFEALPNGSCITLHSCCSLLSYQRMIVGVSRSANAAPSLVDKLASTISLSKHIRFVDSEEGGAVAINNTECNFTSKEQNVSTQKYKSFLDLLLPKGTLPGSISLLLQSLNDSQLAAISRLLNPIAESVDSKLRGHVNLIQGPPGCGKTHVLSAILCVLTLKQYKTMVCAPSNKAICVALETFLQFIDISLLKTTNIVLIGVEDRLESCSTTLPFEHDIHVNDKEERDDDSNSNSASKVNLMRPSSLISASTAAKIEAIVRPSSVSHLYYTHFEPLLYDALSSVVTELNLMHHYSRCNDDLSDKAKSLDTVKLRALYRELCAISEVVLLKCPKYHSKRYISFHNKVYDVCGNFLDAAAGTAYDFSQTVSLLTDHIANVLSSLQRSGGSSGNSSGHSSLAEELIATAQLVFCTTCSSGSGILRHFKDIDMLVVDEAAQLFEPELFVPLQRGPRNLVMIGDPRQLPATIFSTRIHSARLGISAMQRLMDVCDYPFDLLNTQYRMHPAISSLSNKFFYAGQLFDSRFVEKRDCIIQQHWTVKNCPKMSLYTMPKWLSSTFSFIDVSGTERGVAHMSNSMENVAEAVMVSKIVSFLSNTVGLHVGKSVCVITFYAAQVNCIQKYLKQEEQLLVRRRKGSKVSSAASCSEVKVLTVDSFQGSEADCVIVSFVRSNGDSRVGFVKDFQRLNVALTRARHLLLAVGNRKTLENIKQQHHGVPGGVKTTGVGSPALATDHPLSGLILEAASKDCLFAAKDVMRTLQ